MLVSGVSRGGASRGTVGVVAPVVTGLRGGVCSCVSIIGIEIRVCSLADACVLCCLSSVKFGPCTVFTVDDRKFYRLSVL